MKLAYVDSSCLVAIAFDEPQGRGVRQRLARFDRLLASNLLEAEFRSALLRERVSGDDVRVLAGISWIFPNRPLTREFERISAMGYLKGADLWHLACALFLDPDARDLAFLTLDRRQADVATKLGFASRG